MKNIREFGIFVKTKKFMHETKYFGISYMAAESWN